MAIIYSYPLADEVTNDSWVLGSEMENGQRVVKNYSVGDIVSFTRGFVTLNDVLDNDNVSEIDAKIGELYLYDDADGDYGKIRLNDSIFRLIGSNGSDVLYAEGPLLVVGNMRLVGDNLTAPRFFTLPNKDGTIALTNDLVAPNLQQVTDEGANTTIQMQINGVDVATLNDIPTQITKVLKTTITEAQVLQLFTTPITILNSNNPLTVAYPINVYIKRNAGDAYTLVNNSFSVINDFGTTMTGNLNPNPLSNTSIGYFQSAITVSQNLAGGDKNVLYKLRANTGNPTLGTGSLDVYVTYIEIAID